MDQHIRRMRSTLLVGMALLRQETQHCEVQQGALRGPHIWAPHNGRVLPVRHWDRDSLSTICTTATIISKALKKRVGKQTSCSVEFECDPWWPAVLKHALHTKLTRSVTTSRGANFFDLPALG